jgi:hypothetical protein
MSAWLMVSALEQYALFKQLIIASQPIGRTA